MRAFPKAVKMTDVAAISNRALSGNIRTRLEIAATFVTGKPWYAMSRS